jgi:hypothetical protein
LRTSFIAAVVLLFASSAAVYGWGGEGHQIVASIAAGYLTPQAQAGVKDLLGKESMADISSWPDQIRGQKLAQYAWSFRCHGNSMPPEAKTFDKLRDCPNGCAVSAILEMTHVLRDPNADKATRIDALKFLVHFVGDLHQPLHAGNTTDHGGSGIKVEFLGDKMALHALWDGALIRHTGRSVEQYTKLLRGKITPADVREWSGDMSPADWSTESHAAAARYAYVLPADKKLDQAYYEQAIPSVDHRLSQGGVRLAALLNCAFEGPAKAASHTPTTMPCSCPAQ